MHIWCWLVNKDGGLAMIDRSLSCIMYYTVIRSVISSFVISHYYQLSPLENPPCPQISNYIVTPRFFGFPVKRTPTPLPLGFQKAIHCIGMNILLLKLKVSIVPQHPLVCTLFYATYGITPNCTCLQTNWYMHNNNIFETIYLSAFFHNGWRRKL